MGSRELQIRWDELWEGDRVLVLGSGSGFWFWVLGSLFWFPGSLFQVLFLLPGTEPGTEPGTANRTRPRNENPGTQHREPQPGTLNGHRRIDALWQRGSAR
jgi:hypothetical protein